jgi:hypothetical protein
MSTASERNTQALLTMVGDTALAARLKQTRLVVITPTGASSPALQLLSEYVVDTLCRLWEQVDFHGGLAEPQRLAAQAITGAAPAGMQQAWHPGYDVVVALGCRAPDMSAAHIIEIGYDGWSVAMGPDALMGDEPNPAAAAFAAALAASRAFQWVFKDALDGAAASLAGTLRVDLRELYGLTTEPTALILPPTVVFGTGAVGHAFLSILERWPHPVTGVMDLVDPDPYGNSNMQRYTFMLLTSVPQAKVTIRRDALAQRHPRLTVTPHPHDLNAYCQSRGYTERIALAVVALDSPEARRHVALKLPIRAVNMWTEGKRVGGALYAPSDQRACLGCDYLEPKGERMDETARVAQQTGLLPGVVRRLLDTAAGLSAAEAQVIAAHQHVQGESLVGEPLRSVLPALCATGRLALPGSAAPVDVPFAFASLFAGVAGFMFFLRALEGPSVSEGWSQHLFKSPTPLMRQVRGRQEACSCCTNLHLLLPRMSGVA